MSLLVRLLLPLAVLAVGWLGYKQLAIAEKAATPPPPKPRKLETEVVVLKRENFRVKLRSQGVVQAHNQTTITPRVSGRVVSVSSKFESGASFSQADVLIELDPTDFLAELSAAEARLARAEAGLAQELARAEQARLDWKDLGYTTEPTDLVLRKPQLKEAKANVKAAQAALSDAQRDLERTKVRAPYDGMVRERLVGPGQSVSPGTQLGEIFSTDFAEVRLSLSPAELSHIDLPWDTDDKPVPVTLIDALSTDSPDEWSGEIVRTEGALDERSRKLFVIARVDRPFSSTDNRAPLRIGQPMRAIFFGNEITDVFVIPRSAERRPGEIVLVEPEEQRLRRTEITSIWSDEEHLIVRDGLPEGWYLSTSRLSATPQNARVTIIPSAEQNTKAAQTPKPVPET